MLNGALLCILFSLITWLRHISISQSHALHNRIINVHKTHITKRYGYSYEMRRMYFFAQTSKKCPFYTPEGLSRNVQTMRHTWLHLRWAESRHLSFGRRQIIQLIGRKPIEQRQWSNWSDNWNGADDGWVGASEGGKTLAERNYRLLSQIKWKCGKTYCSWFKKNYWIGHSIVWM